MDWDAFLALMIPIVAIVGGVASSIFKKWTFHEQEMARINASRSSELGATSNSEIEALRLEIARLRDTSTQYDMSIQHTLDELRHRVAYLETKSQLPAAPYRPPAQESSQTEQIIAGRPQ